MTKFELNCRGKILQLTGTPTIMGILNVTPDSFSDGGEFLDASAAVGHGLRMIAEGAGIIDVGGESTRPGAEVVDADEQIRRVVPVISALARQGDAVISIDTTSSKVAAAALDAGAGIVNDISALRFDEEMLPLVAQRTAAVVLMHMQGSPGNMQANPTYHDVVQEVRAFLAERIEAAEAGGVERSQIVVDPGIGFGKTCEHNLLLLRELGQLAGLGAAVLVGPSRKSFIGEVLDREVGERVFGTAAAVACCVAGGAQLIRVHDVREMAQVVQVAAAIYGGVRRRSPHLVKN